MFRNYHIILFKYDQSSVAKWLRQLANLGLKPTLSDWEFVSSNPTADMSRIWFFYLGKKFQCFSLTENVSDQFSTQQDHLVAYL